MVESKKLKIQERKDKTMSNITEQEKKFADAFVYLFFHAPALMPGMKEDAAAYAGMICRQTEMQQIHLQLHCTKNQALGSTLMQNWNDSGKSCLTIRA